MVAWGSIEAIEARLEEHFRAGAAQVADGLPGPPGTEKLEQLRRLAGAIFR